MYKIKALLVIIIFHLYIVASNAQKTDPLPLGTFSSTSEQPDKCLPGYSCSGFEVLCPNIESAKGFLAIAPYKGSKSRVLVMFFRGGGGTEWWSAQTPEGLAFMEDLRNLGFSIVQVKWEKEWQSSPNVDAGPAHFACRPATVINYVYENYYLPLGIKDNKVGQAGFCITGNSGGASVVLYALSHYGLDRILDVVIPTGGPPHSNILMTEADEGKGKATGFLFSRLATNAQQDRTDTTYIRRAMEEGVSTGGSDYYHPKTRIHFIEGEEDQHMVVHSKYYSDRLKKEGSPYVTVEIAPNTQHGVMRSPEGRAALKSAIIVHAEY